MLNGDERAARKLQRALIVVARCTSPRKAVRDESATRPGTRGSVTLFKLHLKKMPL
jgi:hypothetical protein